MTVGKNLVGSLLSRMKGHAMPDRRADPRRQVSIETRLFWRSVRPTIIPCQIVDVSKGGAKVQIDIHLRLPPRVFLLRDGNESMYECRTVWQVDRAAGLEFIELCGWAKHDELLREIKTARTSDKDGPLDRS